MTTMSAHGTSTTTGGKKDRSRVRHVAGPSGAAPDAETLAIRQLTKVCLTGRPWCTSCEVDAENEDILHKTTITTLSELVSVEVSLYTNFDGSEIESESAVFEVCVHPHPMTKSDVRRASKEMVEIASRQY